MEGIEEKDDKGKDIESQEETPTTIPPSPSPSPSPAPSPSQDKNDIYTEIDEKLLNLRKNANLWITIPVKQKIEMLQTVIQMFPIIKEEYSLAATKHKKTSIPHEEWGQFAVPVLRSLKQLLQALEPLTKEKSSFGLPTKPKKHHGRYVLPCFPTNAWDGLAYPGVTGEVWIKKGEEFSQGCEFLKKQQSGKGAVALVLGAGNQQSIPVLDAIYKLINCQEVVFLKHNPVNEWLYPVVDKVMSPFIGLGVFAHCKGDAIVGEYLVKNCDNIHITGAERTHDIIVWGNRNKADESTKSVLQEKEITSELGCVTPNIIVPGHYSKSQLKYLAAGLAGATGANCSFNCVAPKLLVTQKDWPQRDQFHKYIKKALKEVDQLYPYYPGAAARHQSFRDTYPQSEQIGESTDEKLPFLWIPKVEPTPGQKAFTFEAWAPVLSETGIDATEDEFLDKAVEFVNNHVWGNLSCSLYIVPLSEPRHGKALSRALENLRYGTVAVNFWSALGYSMGTPWGAYPGNTLRDIQSGIGFVHNPFMVDNVEKSVYKAPFQLIANTKLPWFAGSKNAENFWKTISEFEEDSGASSTTSLIWNAFKNS